MAILTGEEVVSSIATNIRAIFSTTEIKAIYKDTPLQNIKKPYAFIHQINAEHLNEMRGRAEHNFIIDVRVHPEDNQTNVQTWARAIATKMLEALNIITVSGQPVKSRGIEWKVEDNVLHVITRYSYKVIHVEEPIPDMETLLYNDHIKNFRKDDKIGSRRNLDNSK